jgi:hypothetical protein
MNIPKKKEIAELLRHDLLELSDQQITDFLSTIDNYSDDDLTTALDYLKTVIRERENLILGLKQINRGKI